MQMSLACRKRAGSPISFIFYSSLGFTMLCTGLDAGHLENKLCAGAEKRVPASV